MPDGVVRWFDAKSGKGRIGHVEREYVVLEADIEPEARVSQARGHSMPDGRRLRAVNVSLCEGPRLSAAQGRFGDQVGAHDVRGKGQGSALTHGRASPAAHKAASRTRWRSGMDNDL
jgi:hypothetical protein